MSLTNKQCFNCKASLPNEAIFCLNCGQKHTDGRITLRLLIRDFFSEQFNLDSRIFRTLLAIFIPGKLSVEFFKGKHKTYSSPLRLFLISALLFASVTAFLLFQDSNIGGENLNKMIHENERRSVLTTLDSVVLDQKIIFSNKKVNDALDSVKIQMKTELGNPKDSLFIGDNIEFLDFNPPIISYQDFETMTPKELGDLYGKDYGFWEKLFTIQVIKSIKKGDSLVQYLFSKITIALFFMMPFLAISLKIIYLGTKKYYVEHLIFSFHFHAFLFLLFSISIPIAVYFGGGLIGFSFLIAFVYLLIALKRFYKQGWFFTLLRMFITSIVYLVHLIIFMVFTAIISFLLF